ncbi:DNA-binding IclR family transcriptional regulator [Catenulispora sp. GAS73]|uniref:IclR family transcriptional regulator n=1 Tax=Catenulispora sp. GAS73 TaxID=3156269 RepID=UPI003516B8B6
MARPAPAVDRTVAVLNLLAAHPDTAFSLSELCRRLDINKATAHAMLTALADSGFLLRNPRDKSYTLGPALIALGSAAAARRLELVEFARAPMQALASATGLQCVVSSAMGEEIVFLAVAGEVVPFGPHVRVGQRIPLAPPIGTVFMAWSLPDDVDTWLNRSTSGKPLAEPELERFRNGVRAVRRRGYSVGLEPDVLGVRLGQSLDDHEAVPPLLAELSHTSYLMDDFGGSTHRIGHLAAPVFGPDERVAMVLTLYGFQKQLSGADIDVLATRLTATTREITFAVRGRHPDLRVSGLLD